MTAMFFPWLTSDKEDLSHEYILIKLNGKTFFKNKNAPLPERIQFARGIKQ